jgi:hypothetical protein
MVDGIKQNKLLTVERMIGDENIDIGQKNYGLLEEI